uniref:Movement protein n=1 Tax=Jingmen Crocidura shantungensis henipavirus 1 TaxID=2928971 RepID=A0AB38ZJZ9_9MONO
MNPPIYEVPYEWRYMRQPETANRDRNSTQIPSKRFPIYYFLLFIIACFLIFILGYTVIYLLYCTGKDNPGYTFEDRGTFKEVGGREEQIADQPRTDPYITSGRRSNHRRSNCQDKHLP